MKFGGYFPGLNDRELKSLQYNCFGDDGDDEGGGDDRGFFEPGDVRGGRGSDVFTRERSKAEQLAGKAFAGVVGGAIPGAGAVLQNIVGQNTTFNVDPTTGKRIGGGRSEGVSDIGDKDFNQAASSGIQTLSGGSGGGGVANGAIGGAVSEELTGFRESLAEQQRQFDIGQQNLAPFREAGVGALQEQQARLGLLGTEAQQASFASFAESPGQAFLRKQGEKAVLRGASATGGLGGGNVQKALVQHGIGVAAQQEGEQFNRLAGISGTGQDTAVTQAQLGSQFAGNVGQIQQSAAQSRASGLLAQQALEQQQATADSAASARRREQNIGLATTIGSAIFDLF